MKKISIIILSLILSFSIMSAQNEEVSVEKTDTITLANIINIPEKDTSAQEITVSAQDIAEIKEGLNLLLTAELAGFEEFIIKARKDLGFTWGLRFNTPLTSIDSEFIPFDIRVDLGYYIIDRLFLSFIADWNIVLFHENNTKTYSINEALGGGIGYDILQTWIGNLDIRASVGTTFHGKREYKFTYYDAGVYWNQGLRTDLTKITLGLGVRYYDSKTSLHNDKWRAFISMGFKFN